MKQMQIRLYAQFLFGVFYWGNCCGFCDNKICFLLINRVILSFSPFRTLLNCVEFCLIITKTFLNINSPIKIGNSIWQLNLLSPWIHVRIESSLTLLEFQYQVIYYNSLVWIFYQKRCCLIFWIDNIDIHCKNNSILQNKGHNLTSYTFLLGVLFYSHKTLLVQ